MRFALIAGAVSAALMASAGPGYAATEIQLWHAMPGELGRQLETLVSRFNAAQSDYRVLPLYKGSYPETATAAIFAMRTRVHPAIVHDS